jgi:hypothetical protein
MKSYRKFNTAILMLTHAAVCADGVLKVRQVKSSQVKSSTVREEKRIRLVDTVSSERVGALEPGHDSEPPCQTLDHDTGSHAH